MWRACVGGEPGAACGVRPRSTRLVHLAESGDSVPRWVSRKCNMLPKSALLRLWRGSRGSIRYAKALLASKGRETHAGSQGSIDSTFA
jgi:hypothetical protein